MISGHVFLNRIENPVSLEIYASFTAMVESVDCYALIMLAPILGFFFSLSYASSLHPIFIVLVMPSIVKGGRVPRQYIVSS